MRKLALSLVLATGVGGCYGSVGVTGHLRVNPIAVVATAVAVAQVVNAVAASLPPVAVNVEYYEYGARPGQVWVNGRYTYVNNNWAWQNGHWQADRAGYYWVQGSWQPQGNQYAWVDGYWAEPRAGYTYVDGYWDYQDTGYVWVAGNWEVERPGYVYVGGAWTTHQNRRVWQRGGWQHDDGRPEWNHYRTRGRASVRDHRR